MMTDRDYALALIAVRRAAHQRRAAACALVPDRVLGRPLHPITPATWSLLVGTNSAFVSTGPATEADVRNYWLFHQPEFDADRPKAGPWVRFLAFWRLARALGPAKSAEAGRALRLAQAIAEIRAIVDETFADTPMPGDRDPGAPPPLASALEPQFLDLFATRYAQWPLPRPIRHTPLRILTQLARCVDRATYFDRAEAALDEAYLRELNPPPPLNSKPETRNPKPV